MALRDAPGANGHAPPRKKLSKSREHMAMAKAKWSKSTRSTS